MKKVIVRLHWKTGEVQDIPTVDTGDRFETTANAMNEAGIGNGALPALDRWQVINIDEVKDNG